jgi:hypothetical protein
MKLVAFIRDELEGAVVVTVTVVPVPNVICTRTFWDAGVGAFWCGFQSDGKIHASKRFVGPDLCQYGLKTTLLKYGRFLMPASSYGCSVAGSVPKPIKIGVLLESH